MAATSNRPWGAGRRAEPALTSQLRVKLGTILPPTSPISATRTDTAARSAIWTSAPSSTCRWNPILTPDSAVSAIRILRFFQLRPETISLPATAASTGTKAASTTTAG